MRRLLAAALVLAALVVAAVPARAADGEAMATVTRFHDTLITAMKRGPELGYAGRARLIAPVVDATFGIAAMTRVAVGSQANKLTPEQMAELTEAFRRWTVANYASQFKKWEGEYFQTGTPRPSTADAIIVPSRIVDAGGEATQLDYLMRNIDGRWRVVDVLAEGSISQLAVRRSEFVSVLRRQGYDGLLTLLRQKTATLEAE